jgi:hypothetical protein
VLIPLFILVSGAALVDSDTYSKAKAAYDKARYEDVVSLLRDGDVAPLSLEQRSEARFMLGVSELASSSAQDAFSQKAFVALYSDDPDFETPAYTSKKVLVAIDRAKKSIDVQLEPDLQGDAVMVCGRGLSKKAEVKVVFAMPEGEQGGLATLSGRCFQEQIPTSGRATGYYVIASMDGEVRATRGSRAQPLPLSRRAVAPVAASNAVSMPWYKHWATWTIVGVVVAGAVAGTVAGVVIANNNAPGTLSLKFTLPIEGAR